MKKQFNKKQLKDACNQALKNKTDVNTASAMYTDVELKLYRGIK